MIAMIWLVETNHSGPCDEIWDKYIRHYDSSVSLMFLKRRRTELCNAWLVMQHGMVGPMLAKRGWKLLQRSRMITKQWKLSRWTTLGRDISRRGVERWAELQILESYIQSHRGGKRRVGTWHGNGVILFEQSALVDHVEVMENANYSKAQTALYTWLG